MATMMSVPTVGELYPPAEPAEVSALRTTIVAFRPHGTAPVELARALSADERAALGRRKEVLDRWLAGGPPARATASIARMLMGMRGEAVGEEDAEMIAAQYAFALRELPHWAIERACTRFASGLVRPEEVGTKSIDLAFRPSTAQVAGVARALCGPLEGQRGEIEKILRGIVAGARPPGPRGTAAVNRHLDGLDGAAAVRESRRAEEISARQPDVERRTNAARAEEYRRAGLRAPEPKGGLITSLPMMLKAGFTVREAGGGEKVLVAPDAEEQKA